MIIIEFLIRAKGYPASRGFCRLNATLRRKGEKTRKGKTCLIYRVLMFPSTSYRDTFDFSQSRVTKNQPVAVPV